MMSRDHNGIRILARVTNRRQAAKIRDVSATATLYARWPCSREVFVTGVDDGLWTVGYGSGGGLYLARVLEAPQVAGLVDSARHFDVRREWSQLPESVRRPPARVTGGDAP